MRKSGHQIARRIRVTWPPQGQRVVREPAVPIARWFVPVGTRYELTDLAVVSAHRHPEARRGRVNHGGVVPAAREQRADLLPLEGKVRAGRKAEMRKS